MDSYDCVNIYNDLESEPPKSIFGNCDVTAFICFSPFINILHKRL